MYHVRMNTIWDEGGLTGIKLLVLRYYALSLQCYCEEILKFCYPLLFKLHKVPAHCFVDVLLYRCSEVLRLSPTFMSVFGQTKDFQRGTKVADTCYLLDSCKLLLHFAYEPFKMPLPRKSKCV